LVDRVTNRENEMLVFVRSITVALLEPIGGDVIPSGSTYTIRWEGSSPAVKFGLLYSMNNGLTWRWVTADFVTGTSYDWRVPTPPGNKKTCLVKVIGYDGSDKRLGTDLSDAPFTIEVAKLTTPNGGEQLTSNALYSITWEANETARPVAKVTLSFTKDGGVTWVTIKTLMGNPKSHEWKVPTVIKARTKCKVKMVLKDAAGVNIGSDVSDAYFTITP
jgi:hypothetical protein